MSELVERLRALSNKLDTSIKVQGTTPTKLSTYLYLYIAAKRECYINYMEGAKALYNWLAPIEIKNYPYRKLHSLHLSYEMEQLINILTEGSYDMAVQAKVRSAVWEELCNV